LLPAALLRRIESSDPSLTSVSISGNRWSVDDSKYIGPRRIVGLADALRLNTCITSLNLAGNKLGSDGVRTLMRGVTALTGLTSLNLSYNELSADDCTREDLIGLTSFDLTANDSSDSMNYVVDGLRFCTNLTAVNLSFNQLTADDGARFCSAAMAAGLTVLQKLNLEGNGFDATSLVRCDAWAALNLPQPPDEVTRQGFDALIQYLLSEDKVATNSIRIFVVGESTVRCYSLFFYCFATVLCSCSFVCNV
jgi:hypothetical protein